MKEVMIAFIVALFVGACLNGLGMAFFVEKPLTPAQTSSNRATEESTDVPSFFTADDADSSTDRSSTSNSGSGQISVTETDQDKFSKEVLLASKPVLVDFYADWCGPCKQMSPVIEKLANQYDGRLQVYKVNIDKNPRLVAKYNIQSIPTFIIYKNGASVESFAGSMPRAELSAAIDKHLN